MVKSAVNSRKGQALRLIEPSNRLRVAFKPEILELAGPDKVRALTVHVPDLIELRSSQLVIDIYDFANQRHPEGHFGWWSVQPQSGKSVRFRLARHGNGLDVSASGERDKWVNPDAPSLADVSILLIHLVLRSRLNNAVLSQQSLVAFCTRDALNLAKREGQVLVPPTADPRDRQTARGFNMPDGTTVHLVTQAVPAPDRIADRPVAIQLARQLADHGVPASLYATTFDPRYRGRVAATPELQDRLRPGDLLIVLCDEFEPNISWLRELDVPKAFVHLGLPSSERLAAFDAELHRNYLSAREDLEAVADFDLVIAADERSERELDAALETRRSHNAKRVIGPKRLVARRPSPRRAERLDLLERPAIWDEVGQPAETGLEAGYLLCAAPMEPDSNLPATLSVFEKLCEIAPEAHLVLASQRHLPVYADYVRFLLDRDPGGLSGQVTLRLGVSDREMKSFYQNCGAVMHLGVAVPFGIDDALHFGKPLFVNGAVADNRYDAPGNVFRLYGSEAEQATAIASVLQSGTPVTSRPANSDSYPATARPPVLSVVDRLLQVSTRRKSRDSS